MSWTEQDPGQGDPDDIACLASQLQEVSDVAAQVRVALQGLKDNTSDAIWRGTSADAFRHRIARLPGHLDKLAHSYSDAADGTFSRRRRRRWQWSPSSCS